MPDPIDIEIGQRIKLRRKSQGMTQKELGEKLGVTFQQIQKYEKGLNRIGAGRIARIAHALNTSVYMFFDEIPLPSTIEFISLKENENPDSKHIEKKNLHSKHMIEAMELLQAFDAICSAKTRRTVINMTQAIVSDNKPTG